MNRSKVLARISTAYVALLPIYVIALLMIPSFEEVGHLARGCYLTDALVPGAKCNDFWGAPVVQAVLNLPLMLLFIPPLAVAGLLEFRIEGVGAALLATALWAPIVYLIWYRKRVAT